MCQAKYALAMHPSILEAAEKVRLYAAGHCDKKPTCIVSTRGTTRDGYIAKRTWRGWANGDIITQHYELPQKHIMWLYRNFFNAVDIFNRMGLGKGSLQEAIGT